jgi:CRISPR system Cascade subunit CasB
MNRDRIASDRAFVGFLESLLKHDDRATLAALRRALGHNPTAAIEAYPYVIPRVAPDISPAERDREEQIYLLAAGLFAFHQISWPRDDSEKAYTNFGASMARLASVMDSAGVERRMSALLACSFHDLPEHLRHAASLLKSKQIPVDWARLIADLRWWNTEDRRVQREWARAFWASTRESTEETEPAEQTGEEN